jgi:hypothetical protein
MKRSRFDDTARCGAFDAEILPAHPEPAHPENEKPAR